MDFAKSTVMCGFVACLLAFPCIFILSNHGQNGDTQSQSQHLPSEGCGCKLVDAPPDGAGGGLYQQGKKPAVLNLKEDCA